MPNWNDPQSIKKYLAEAKAREAAQQPLPQCKPALQPRQSNMVPDLPNGVGGDIPPGPMPWRNPPPMVNIPGFGMLPNPLPQQQQPQTPPPVAIPGFGMLPGWDFTPMDEYIRQEQQRPTLYQLMLRNSRQG